VAKRRRKKKRKMEGKRKGKHEKIANSLLRVKNTEAGAYFEYEYEGTHVHQKKIITDTRFTKRENRENRKKKETLGQKRHQNGERQVSLDGGEERLVGGWTLYRLKN